MNKYFAAATVLCCLLFAGSVSGQWVSMAIPGGGTITSLAANGRNLFAGTYYGVFRSSDSGTTWGAVNSGLTHQHVLALTLQDSCIFAGTDSGVFRSDNDGMAWDTAGLQNNSITTFAVMGNRLFAGSNYNDSGVYVSADRGVTWRAAGLKRETVYALASKDGLLCAGTTNGIFISIDSGAAWSQRNNGLNGLRYVWTVAMTDNYLLAGIENSVYRTSDSGRSWTLAGRIGGAARTFAVSGGFLFASYASWADNGVDLSVDEGTSWVSAGLQNPFIDILAMAVAYGFVYAADYSTIYRRPLSEFATGVRPDFQQKAGPPRTLRITLSGGVCNVEYSVASLCAVRFEIYSLSGKRVAVIEQGFKDAGEYRIKIDGRGMAGRVYVYRFRAGDYRETGKVLVRAH